MRADYMRILQKLTDYKICGSCNAINWYENKFCINCQETNKFRECLELDLESEYNYYKNEGYTEIQIDNIEIDV